MSRQFSLNAILKLWEEVRQHLNVAVLELLSATQENTSVGLTLCSDTTVQHYLLVLVIVGFSEILMKLRGQITKGSFST